LESSSALYGIVAVLAAAKSALTHLLLAGCSGLTPSGIFYLSNLEPVTANRLQEIDVRGALTSVSPLESVENVSAALLNALQLASFQGLLRTGM
jgi:hypothetical protein